MISIVLVLVLMLVCSIPVLAEDVPSLKETYHEHFLVGFAAGSSYLTDKAITEKHFNAVTAENMMKWESIHPQPGVFRFDDPDNLVHYAKEHGMSVTGHTLIWHNQTPSWVFTDDAGNDVTREELLARMEEYIKAVVGHYRGKIKGWDVVNEAIEQNPITRKWELRDSKWRQIIGDDYIEYVFRFAHEADPKAELYYNDYSASEPGKREAIYELVKGLLEQGIRVDGIGMQGHWDINDPSEQRIRDAIELYASLGMNIHITELDVSVFPWNDRSNRYAQGLPDSVAQKQAERYAMFFRVFRDYSDVIERVTFWGVKDSDSWKNNFPVRGRKDYPLLFDAEGEPKPAFWASLP